MSQYLIGTVTVGAGGQATIDFTSIPQGFTDLMLTYSTRPGTTDNSWVQNVWFNGSSANRSSRVLEGTGAGSASYNQTTVMTVINQGSSATASTFSNGSIYIPNYAGSTYKAISADGVSETNATTAYQWLVAGLFSSTAPITQVSLVAATNYAQGSTASLYGIKNLPASLAKASGGNITFDANYVYHAFTGSGTFTPTTSLTADVLVVAGGGAGGGAHAGGGGGGGGYKALTTSLAASTGYSVTIGAGGSIVTNNVGGSGSASSFGANTTVGGGGGASEAPGYLAISGGSGGGGSGANIVANATGAVGTYGQGNTGGNGSGNASAYGSGGGGGGGGAVGGNATGALGGAGGVGGAGAQWVNGTYYAGGGAGGSWGDSTVASSGGIGGGGAGGYGIGGSGISGTTNTGSGGGGSPGGGSTRAGGNGGSGIVIIRYAR